MVTVGEHRTYLAFICTENVPPRCGDIVMRSVADLNYVAPQWGWGPTAAQVLNAAWCAALISRRQFEWTHFCAVRGDVRPWGDDWLGVMLDELRRVSVEYLSAVVPLAGDTGLTGCAVEEFGSSCDRGRTRRLTMTEVDPLPQITLTGADLEGAGFPGCRLLPGAEMFVCDFRKPWVERVRFHDATTIRVTKGGNNTPGAALAKLKMPEDWATDLFEAEYEPEGWAFARQLHALGVPMAATRRVPCGRVGVAEYGNMAAWGKIEHDDWHHPPEPK